MIYSLSGLLTFLSSAKIYLQSRNKMKLKICIIYSLLLFILSACDVSDKEFMQEIEKAERISVTETFHGGIGGSGQINYVLQRSGFFPENEDWILIRDENTQFQTYILVDTIQLNNFRLFIKSALKTHDSLREYQNSCTVIGPNPNEYDIKVNGYSRHLQPDDKTDSLFYTLTKEFCLSKHVYE